MWIDRLLMAAGVLVVLALVVLLPYSIVKTNEWNKICKEAGGVPAYIYKSQNLCLNPSAIVELK